MRSIVRAFLWLLLAAWLVLFVGWLSLHWLILPHIEEWRPSIEARASDMLGTPIRIGAIEARSTSAAVRTSVGVCDVSTLGKIDVQGPDAATFLDRVYINKMTTLAVGKTRYGVMLHDDGLVLGAEIRLFQQISTGITKTYVLPAVPPHAVEQPDVTPRVHDVEAGGDDTDDGPARVDEEAARCSGVHAGVVSTIAASGCGAPKAPSRPKKR